MNTYPNYDLIVIGGGPAGSTVATLVAEQGHRVLLLEREAEPKFKIGESLIPATYWTFKRLGMLEKLRASHFPQKYSVQFYSRTGKASSPFYFFQTNPHESAVTWQVLRSEFDEMLLDNAKEKGVEVKRGIRVREVLFEGDTATGVVIQGTNGIRETLKTTVIVDSTGQRSLIGRQLDLNTTEPNLKMASLFTHYEGGHRDEGIDEGATLILHTEEKDSWFWSIPLPYDRTSIGVVGEIDYLLQNRRDANGRLDAQRIFTEELEKCPALKMRLDGAEQLFPIQTTKDFSYRASRIAGNNWVLVGDAFGFLILSTRLGCSALNPVRWQRTHHRSLRKDVFSAAQLGNFGPAFVDGMEAFGNSSTLFTQKNLVLLGFYQNIQSIRAVSLIS